MLQKNSIPFLLLVTVSLFFSCTGITPYKCVHCGFKLTASIDRSKLNLDSNLIYVKVKLKNLSTDTARHIIMSCSWRELFTIDREGIYVIQEECNKNVPKLIQILPLNEEEFKIQLRHKINKSIKDSIQFKVGFNYVPAENFDDMFLKLPQLSEMKNIIWSDDIMLK